MNLQKILRPVVLGLLFLIPIFPLIVANQFFFPFITGKAFYFRILVELAFAGWVILAFLDARYRPRVTALTVTVSLFALITLVADLIGVSPLRSIWSNFERMEGWLVIAHLWAFFMVAVHTFGTDTDGRRMWHRWLNTSLVVASVVGLYGIFQLLGWAVIHQGSTRIDASLGNAAYMAVYMLIHAFMAAYLFFSTRVHKQSSNAVPMLWAYGVLAVLFSFLVFQTATRGTMLALIGGAVLSLLIYSVFGKKEPVKSRWISAGIIAFIILLGGIFWANKDAEFVQKSEVFSRLASISLSESKTQARGYIWPMAITGFKERPLLGWGQENFNYIFNANYNPKMWSQEQWFDRAHNVYLDWLTASGIVGLLAYLALYVLAFRAIWRSPLAIAKKSVLTGLVAAYAVHNVFVFDNLASYVLFFAVLGFLNMFYQPKNIKILGTRPVRQDAVEYIVAPVVLVLLVAGLYFLNIRPIQANVRLISALQSCGTSQPDLRMFERTLGLDQSMANQEIREQLMACSSNVISGQYSNVTKQAFFTLVKQEIDKQITTSPDDTRVYTLAGSFYNNIGQFTLAAPLLEKAVELSPNKQSTILQLVNTYANQGKNDEALTLVMQMYEMTPEHPAVRETYARVLILADREKEARQLFGDDLSLFENEFVAQIYASQKKYTQSIALYRKLIAADDKNVQLRGGLAQVQVQAGLKSQAIETLRAVQKDFPELKDQVEAAIKGLE
jgi:O-antigen ligase/thioredoxin-like negative regulator of GroEL